MKYNVALVVITENGNEVVRRRNFVSKRDVKYFIKKAQNKYQIIGCTITDCKYIPAARITLRGDSFLMQGLIDAELEGL